MTFKLLDHESVPHHEIIGEEEVANVLEKFAIDKEKLPKIRYDDPIALEIGAKIGDVVKITRKSQTAEESFYYRLVIDTIA
ncbi:MAG: DNA-directed RNA polymerase subunit H [Methanimicrococcus sp.]|nr:DNA-directed RNA polymerase subunit H [Methanimicrococcus sp.]